MKSYYLFVCLSLGLRGKWIDHHVAKGINARVRAWLVRWRWDGGLPVSFTAVEDEQ